MPKKRDLGGGITVLCCSFGADGRSITQKLQALTGTLQPAEFSARPAQLLSGLARHWKGSWTAVLCPCGAMPSVSPSVAPTGPSTATEVLQLALWEKQA